jgi:hypothetical protein
MRVDAATANTAAQAFADEMKSRTRDYEPRHKGPKAEDPRRR